MFMHDFFFKTPDKSTQSTVARLKGSGGAALCENYFVIENTAHKLCGAQKTI